MPARTPKTAFVLAVSAVLCGLAPHAAAEEIINRNPFDPKRQPWKKPEAALPPISASELQVEGIIAFGATRVVIAQLDGRLKGSLPANAAGKVRINVGQSFGGGYVLESVDNNQVVVAGGSARFTIPIVRKSAAATLAGNPGAAPPTFAPPPAAAPVPPVASAPTTASAVPPAINPFAAAAAARPDQAATPPTPAPTVAVPPAPAAPPTFPPPSAPKAGMSLLEAIRAAQAKNAAGSPPAANPFEAKN